MTSSRLFSRLLFVLLLGTARACLAQFGYAVAEAAAPAYGAGPFVAASQVAASQVAPSGFGRPHSGTFLELQGASLTVGDLPKDAQDVVSALNADTSYGLMATLGHIGSSGFGFDLSVGYYSLNIEAGVDGLYKQINADVAVDLTLVPIFLELRYNLGLSDTLSLEVGGGIGGVYASATGSANTSVGDFYASRDAFAGGYELLGGLTLALGQHADLTLHYRYLMLSTADDLSAQSLGLGLRLRL